MVTETQKKHLQDSWQKIKTTGNLDDRGREMFLRLFQQNPELLPLYPFAADKDTPEKLQGSERLRRHGANVLKYIDTYVNGLDDLDTVKADLSALGERHATYGATNSHFAPIGGALMFMLESNLGKEWKPDVRDSWVALYEVISVVMGEKMP